MALLACPSQRRALTSPTRIFSIRTYKSRIHAINLAASPSVQRLELSCVVPSAARATSASTSELGSPLPVSSIAEVRNLLVPNFLDPVAQDLVIPEFVAGD
jgi:hypothetical protein